MTQALLNFWQDEEGVTAIEYGLIAALIAVVIIAAVATAGSNLNILWQKIASCLEGAAAGQGCPAAGA